MTEILSKLLSSYRNSTKPSLDRKILVCWAVFRPLSWLPSAIFIRLGWSATAVTLLGALTLPIVWIMLTFGPLELAPFAYLLYFFFVILDYVDGNIARYRKNSTFFGKTMDGFVDHLSNSTFIFVAYNNVRQGSTLFSSEMEILAAAWAYSLVALNGYTEMRLRSFMFEVRQGKETETATDKHELDPSFFRKLFLWVERAQENVIATGPLILLLLGTLGLATYYTWAFFVLFSSVFPARIALKLYRSQSALNQERDH